MMKKILKTQILATLLLSTSILADTHNSCDNLIGCKKKACHIEQGIIIAQKMKDEDRIKGLEISLKKVNKYCTNDTLIKDLEDKIKDSKKDLQEDEEDYAKAVKNHRADKMKKYSSKISEEKSNLSGLELELKELQ